MSPVQQGQKAAWRLFYWLAAINVGILVVGNITAPTPDPAMHLLNSWSISILASGIGLLLGAIIGHFRLPPAARKAFWLQLILVLISLIGVVGVTCGANLMLLGAR